MHFNWLHLTDLHCGMAEQGWLWQNVREQLFADLAYLHPLVGPWDLILFTGDLTDRGTRKQFDELDTRLTELLAWISERQDGRRPILLAVPGNHDLQRDKAKSVARGEGLAQLQDWSGGSNIQRTFWENDKSSGRKTINGAFGEYCAWWERTILPQLGSNGLTVLTRGLLPGDFSATIENANGCHLGVLGMNTAFLQLTAGDYASKLALHTRQFHAACGGDGPAWAKTHNACLLLTHHPAECLDTDSHQHLDGEITNGGRFAAHLCGHLHAPRRLHIATDGNQPKWLFQGRSLFGLETYGDQQERLHGYAAGRITVGPDQGTLVLWPRGYHRAGPESHLDRDPDQHLPRGSDSTQPSVFRLAFPCRPNGGHSQIQPETGGWPPAGPLFPAWRVLAEKVRERVRDCLQHPGTVCLVREWGADPLAALAAPPPTEPVPALLQQRLDGLHTATEHCIPGWRVLADNPIRAIKDDCRFLLSELIKLAVNPAADAAALATVAAAGPDRLHLACRFGGTGDVVFCALSDLPHLLTRRDRDIAASTAIHLDDLLSGGQGKDLRQEVLKKLWKDVMPEDLPGRIEGNDYNRLIRRIERHGRRDKRRYLLAALGEREWCKQGQYRDLADDLNLGLVLYEDGQCAHLLLDEPDLIDLVREYLELLETL
jgi:3',5'-cyclic AMP phosphodiesterase CpdA